MKGIEKIKNYIVLIMRKGNVLLLVCSVCIFLFRIGVYAQDLRGLVNTSNSPHARLTTIGLTDVKWTNGFWAERFKVCHSTMVPHMIGQYMDPDLTHSFRNFEIAAGLETGKHDGPPFHDGDFYKLLESAAAVYAVTKDAELDEFMDKAIEVIAAAQRADGYIHTPVIIEQKDDPATAGEFRDRLDFETYNMGHLMTAACVHYRATGKTSLLSVAKKATDYLYDFYKRASPELARNAICPSHYMGVVEMYRTTNDPRYLELAKNLIDIRGMVENGTDHNQDRIPFRQQEKAVGHAVRANYLYAGVADVYAETGDNSLLKPLNLIWKDVVKRKMYITGACGALYDGVSPDGTSYNPAEIQQVHQAYGRPYQLPNLTAHNESCANVGNVLWNWRMLQVTGDAKYADVVELALYNSVLSAISLNGKKFFYTNPLAVSDDLPFKQRWSKERESYIALSNCCPPNIVRTIAEISNYAYSISDKGLWFNLYGSNELSTRLKSGAVKLSQETNYPWDGNIKIELKEVPDEAFSIFMRIPGWSRSGEVSINGQSFSGQITPGEYLEINRKWSPGDEIELVLPMPVKVMEANPLVEETRNQVAVKRGPIVYCLESVDHPDENIFGLGLPINANFTVEPAKIAGSKVMALETNAVIMNSKSWEGQLYREVKETNAEKMEVQLIPYYAWGNRGKAEMTVWVPMVY